MKNTLPWILTLIFAGATLLLYSGSSKKEQELAKLRSQSQELETVRAQLEEVKQSTVDQNEIERLRKENEEVYKLRGQVAQLQRKVNELQSRPPETIYVQQPVEVPQPEPVPAQPVVEDPLTRMQREQAEKCIQNIKIIEEAKTMWAVANNKSAGVTMTIADITTALPNETMPVCPAGGTYSLNEVGIPPHCSVPGHSLLP